ncbi:MAG: hypothetical protein U1F11_07755 [Steroidobacteraceae bacterium]
MSGSKIAAALLLLGVVLWALTAAWAGGAAQAPAMKGATMPAGDPTMKGMAMPAAAGKDDAALIASAMRAAPAKVSAGATIIDMGADGKVRTVRAGSNGWTCMADNPATPGPDSMCMDKAGLDWANALMGHKPPPAGHVGFIYMLEGGTDASNTDPYATAPTATNHWIKTGPHVMVVGADKAFYDQYPHAADPDTKTPYVMYYGTPYLHLMAPIQ